MCCRAQQHWEAEVSLVVIKMAAYDLEPYMACRLPPGRHRILMDSMWYTQDLTVQIPHTKTY